MIEAGVLPAPDVVLDAGVDTVAGFEERELPAGSVGGEQLVAPAVGFFPGAQLRPGRGAFAAADDPYVGGPVREQGSSSATSPAGTVTVSADRLATGGFVSDRGRAALCCRSVTPGRVKLWVLPEGLRQRPDGGR
jgi:hypothetical protein